MFINSWSVLHFYTTSVEITFLVELNILFITVQYDLVTILVYGQVSQKLYQQLPQALPLVFIVDCYILNVSHFASIVYDFCFHKESAYGYALILLSIDNHDWLVYVFILDPVRNNFGECIIRQFTNGGQAR